MHNKNNKNNLLQLLEEYKILTKELKFIEFNKNLNKVLDKIEEEITHTNNFYNLLIFYFIFENFNLKNNFNSNNFNNNFESEIIKINKIKNFNIKKIKNVLKNCFINVKNLNYIIYSLTFEEFKEFIIFSINTNNNISNINNINSNINSINKLNEILITLNKLNIYKFLDYENIFKKFNLEFLCIEKKIINLNLNFNVNKNKIILIENLNNKLVKCIGDLKLNYFKCKDIKSANKFLNEMHKIKYKDLKFFYLNQELYLIYKTLSTNILTDNYQMPENVKLDYKFNENDEIKLNFYNKKKSKILIKKKSTNELISFFREVCKRIAEHLDIKLFIKELELRFEGIDGVIYFLRKEFS